MNNLESKDMDMEAKAQALREAVEGGASNSDLVQMLAEIQAEPVEPVATVVARQYDDGTYAGNALDWAGRNCEDDFPVGTKLYTAPPQRKPLTEEEIDHATAQARDALLDHIHEYGTAAEGVLERIRKLCRAVERTHGMGGKDD